MSSDAGQWIMLSRFYRGLPVPSYLTPMAYPPIYLVLLALSVILINNAAIAFYALGATIFVLLSVSFFAVGNELWGVKAGFMALVLGSVSQYFFLYATSWGAFPQLLFFAWMNFAISRFAAINRSGNPSSRQILSFSLFVGLSLFTHAPSAIVLITVLGGLFIVHLVSRMKDLKILGVIKMLLAALLPLTAWGVYVAFFSQEMLGYIGSEASLYTRGISTVWFMLFRFTDSTAFILLSVLGMTLGLIWASKRKTDPSAFGFNLVGFWTFSLVILMCGLYLIGIQTEYTRFAYFIIPPLVLSLAGALSLLVQKNIEVTLSVEGLKPRHIRLNKWFFPIILIMLVLPFPAIHGFYQGAIQYYSGRNTDDLQAVFAWAKNNLPSNETVLTASPRDGRWLEGLTGTSAIFFMPARSSYRPWEHNRSLVADTIFTSSAAIENGYLLVKFQEAQGSTPLQPAILVNRDGEYVNAFWMRDSLTRVKLLTTSGTVQDLSLSDFQRASHEYAQESNVVRVISKFEKGVDTTKLYVIRTVTITSDKPVVSISYEIGAVEGFYFKDLSLGVLDPWDQTRKSTEFDKELRIKYGTETKTDMTVRLTWDQPAKVVLNGSVSKTDHRVVTWLSFFNNRTSTARVGIKIAVPSTGRLVNDLRFFKAAELIEEYNIKATLIPKDDKFWYRIINLQNLGFKKVFENDSYVILTRSQNA